MLCFSLSEGGRREFFVKVWCLSLEVCGHQVLVKIPRKFHISLLAKHYVVEDVTCHPFSFLL